MATVQPSAQGGDPFHVSDVCGLDLQPAISGTRKGVKTRPASRFSNRPDDTRATAEKLRGETEAKAPARADDGDRALGLRQGSGPSLTASAHGDDLARVARRLAFGEGVDVIHAVNHLAPHGVLIVEEVAVG